MIEKQGDNENKSLMAKALGISRSIIYYRSKKLAKDWELKNQIENVLINDPSYGYRRVGNALHINKKKAQRVMRLFGIKAYRRRGRKPKKKGIADTFYPNLLKMNFLLRFDLVPLENLSSYNPKTLVFPLLEIHETTKFHAFIHFGQV